MVEERKEDEAAPPPDIVTLEISLITFSAWKIIGKVETPNSERNTKENTTMMYLLAGMVHPQHLLPLESLVRALFHHILCVPCCIQVRQQVALDEGFRVVDHKRHDHFGDKVTAGLGDYLHVGVDEVPDCLNLPLKLGVHRASIAPTGILKA